MLRLEMSNSSREIKYTPITWRNERLRVKKTKKQMNNENLRDNATNIERITYSEI